MTKLLQSIIAEIHDSPYLAVLAVTGGGSAALSRLLGVSGASRTVLEALVPYNSNSLIEFLGGEPDQFCSAKTARAMAMASFQRALCLSPDTDHRLLLGLGATAALTTDRARRGENKIYVCVQSLEATREMSLVLNEPRDRQGEENLAATFIVDALAEACGLPVDLSLNSANADQYYARVTPGKPAWQRLLNGDSLCTNDQIASPQAVFPGAFNPLHDGHRTMIRLAESILNKPVTLEISSFNVDKPALDFYDMQHRENALAGEFPLVFTHAPTFLEKSAIFPGVPFIVGVDTIKRIAQPRYYNNNTGERDGAIAMIADRGNEFLVFGRRQADKFETLDDLTLPVNLRNICHGVEEEIFRHDISSSALRQL